MIIILLILIKQRSCPKSVVENKEFECTIANNNIESRFSNHVFYQLWLH